MEHLIKQYFRFLGERLHQKKIFPNFLTEVHFFTRMTIMYLHYFQVMPRNQQDENTVGFFMLLKPLKNTT
jgi:hypothetical protein